MVCRTHKYADGGKIVKDHLAPEYKKPSFTDAVVDRVKGFFPSSNRSAIKEAAKAVAPKSITQRKARIDQAIEEAGG